MANLNALSARNDAISKMQKLNTEYRGVTPLKFYEPLNVTLAEVLSTDDGSVTNIAIGPIHRLGALADLTIGVLHKQGVYIPDNTVEIPMSNNDTNDTTEFTISAYIIPGKTAITSIAELSAWVTSNRYSEAIGNKRTFFGLPIEAGLITTTIGKASFVKLAKGEKAVFNPVTIKIAGCSLALCRERLSNINWTTDSNEEGVNLTPMDNDDNLLNGAGVLCVEIKSPGGAIGNERQEGQVANYQLVAEYTMFETHSGSLANSLPGMYATNSY